jgi:hypothetical protein
MFAMILRLMIQANSYILFSNWNVYLFHWKTALLTLRRDTNLLIFLYTSMALDYHRINSQTVLSVSTILFGSAIPQHCLCVLVKWRLSNPHSWKFLRHCIWSLWLHELEQWDKWLAETLQLALVYWFWWELRDYSRWEGTRS